MTGGRFLDDARKQGHVLVASGWQGDIEPSDGIETLSAPVAKNSDGSSITGPVLARFSDMPANTTTLPILRGGVAGTADPASLDTAKATLTRRASESGTVVPLRSSDWAFADCTKNAYPGTPDPRKICVKGGFSPAYLYELVYTAKDPKVHGIGFAATRDLNAYLRYGIQDDTGTPNILQGKVTWAPGRLAKVTRSLETSFAVSYIWVSIRVKPDASSSTAATRILPLASWR